MDLIKFLIKNGASCETVNIVEWVNDTLWEEEVNEEIKKHWK